ncbi:MAG: hypothetical protein M1497_02250 [Nitrospirae bacterium]|nr:hypothetical protein [Nitrospirota bacterium]
MKQIAFLAALLCLVATVPTGASAGDVNINIGIPLPPLAFAGPPDVVVVPSGTAYVYVVPDTTGLYFYGGYWYRFHGSRWYRSSIYSGPWVVIETRRVPRFVVNVPPDYYRHLPPGYHRIHYGDLHRDWRRWDRSRHWNKYDWYKREYREHEKGRHGGRDSMHDGRGHKEGKRMHPDDRRGMERGR